MYTSSRFTTLKGNCPICLGEHKSCRQQDELIHCRSHQDAPAGYRYVGTDGINFAMYAPVKGDDYKVKDSETLRAQREAREAKLARRQARELAALPTIDQKDQQLRSYPQKLTIAQNTNLLRRGLTQDEINFVLSKGWIFGLNGGFGVAAIDPVTGKFCGAQRANDDRTKGKYTWGVFPSKNKLKETGENPLFVWVSPDFNPAIPYEIKFCEGALKPLIRAFFEWRSDPQVIVIGGVGGIFGIKSLERILGIYGDAENYVLLPDADSQKTDKINLKSAYGNLAAAVPAIKFADWGHWQKSKEDGGQDCDETYGTDAFNGYRLRSPEAWLSFFEKSDFDSAIETAKKRLETSDKLDADLYLTDEQFQNLTPEKFKELTGGARDVMLNAGTAAGKTKFAAKLAQQFDRCLAPFHRQALGKNGSHKLGFDYRTNCDRQGKNFISNDGYVKKLGYCNESYLQVSHTIKGLLNDGAFVFGDEFDQQLENLHLSSTHGKAGRRRLHLDGFSEVFRLATATLCTSADITNYEVMQFYKMTGRKPFVIKVKRKLKPYEAFIYEQFLDFLEKLKEYLGIGKRCLILCTRKSDAKFLAWYFGGRVVHADNTSEYQDFLEDPDPWLTENKPQILIASPILGTGYSIEGNQLFDAVFGFFKADNIPAKGLIQFLNRYRPNVERHVYCDFSSGKFEGLTREDLYQQALIKCKSRDIANTIDPDSPYFHYTAENNWSLAHLRPDMYARLVQDVESVHFVKSQLTDKERKLVLKEFQQKENEFKEAYLASVANARNLTKSEAENLLKKNPRDLTEGDRLAIEKYQIADWSCLDPSEITLELVKRDNKGKKRKGSENLEMQGLPQIAERIDRDSLEKQVRHGRGISHQDLTNYADRVKILESLGINDLLDFVLSGAEWSANTPEIAAIAQKIIANRDYLAAMGIRLTCGKQAGYTTIIGALLSNYFGLKTERNQRRINGKVTSFYSLCPNDLALTKQALIARLDRNIERYQLTNKPEKSFLESFLGCHIPLQTINNTKVCDSNFESEPLETMPTGLTTDTPELPTNSPAPEPNPIPEPVTAPAPPPPQAPIKWRVGMKAMCNGFEYVIKQLGTLIVFLQYEGSPYLTQRDISELTPIPS